MLVGKAMLINMRVQEGGVAGTAVVLQVHVKLACLGSSTAAYLTMSTRPPATSHGLPDSCSIALAASCWLSKLTYTCEAAWLHGIWISRLPAELLSVKGVNMLRMASSVMPRAGPQLPTKRWREMKSGCFGLLNIMGVALAVQTIFSNFYNVTIHSFALCARRGPLACTTGCTAVC